MEKLKLACVLAGALVALAGCGSGDGETQAPTATETTETTAPTETTEAEPTTETTTETGPDPTSPVTIRIVVRDGRPVGGIARPSVKRGDRLVLVVTSNVRDHVHVHGYDLFADVGPGRRARIAFRATVPGRFEIELEDRRVPVAELTVGP